MVMIRLFLPSVRTGADKAKTEGMQSGFSGDVLASGWVALQSTPGGSQDHTT